MARAIYYVLENIALTGSERDAFFDLNRQEGTLDSPYPNLNNHQRDRLDGEAVIFEGDFPDLTPGRMIALLAQVYAENTQAAPNMGMEYGDEFIIRTTPPGPVDVCRMIIFGGVSATWEESREACSQYITDNYTAWEGEEGGF